MASGVDRQDVGTPHSTSGVLVSCRLRGPSPAEKSQGGQDAVHNGGLDNTISVTASSSSASHTFHFDHVFSPSASQEEVFHSVGAPCVRDLLLGYNCTLLAYGQTGSGKTHTTIGGSGDGPDTDGLVPRMLELLFSSTAQEPDTTITASFVEVYQERLRDLLLPTASATSSLLRIRDEKSVGGNGVWVDGATEIALRDLATARAVVQRGLKHRTVGATRMNRDSSRSHAVFAVTVTRRNPAAATSSKLCARLCVVDLAGSEQAKKTRASGVRLDEAKHINRSLSALGNVIHALTGGGNTGASSATASYVPYRDSKLTRLLQSSLGGNAKTHLLLTCATACCHADETLSTLRFGARAKLMQNQPTVNVNATGRGGAGPQRDLLETLQRKVESLCRYICELEDAASRCRCARTSICPPGHEPVPGELSATNEAAELDPASSETEESVGEEECDPSDTTETPSSSDLLMRAELLTLRNALDEMQRLQRHEQLHAQQIQDAVASVEQNEIEKLHARQAHEIELLEEQLTTAEREIATLQAELRLNQDSQGELTRKLSHLESALRRDENAASAESDILRRRLDHSERLLRTTQLELSASRAEIASLRLELENSETERSRMHSELDAAVQKLQVTATVTTKAPPSPPPPVRSTTKPVLRPVTVAAGSSGAIQSWWAGEDSFSTNNCEEDDARRSPLTNSGSRICRSRLDDNAGSRLEDRVLARASRCSTSVGGPSQRHYLHSPGDGDCSPVRDGQSDRESLAESDRKHQKLHTSGGSRPFRARLVGLLNSLEAETSSYKELLLESQSPPLLLLLWTKTRL